MSDRSEWCRSRKPGTLSAVTLPGEEIRCPGTQPSGLVCGHYLGRPMPNTRVILRVKHPRLPSITQPGKDFHCPECGTPLEEFVTVRLEAAG